MCFIPTKTEKATIATNDIKVYKAVQRLSNGKVSSPYKNFTWERGKIRSTGLMVQNSSRGIGINNGFHSCILKSTARQHTSTVFVFTIPKGAKYFINHVEYVSNKLCFGVPDRKPKRK